MSGDRISELISLARDIAAGTPEFQMVLGPGAGDKSTHRFMRALQEKALATLGSDFSEKKICGDNEFAVDFYFPEEETVVEVALGLPNPNTEFEKDILKAIMAKEVGHRVGRLVFISRAGAKKKCGQPGRSAVMAWAAEKHGLRIEVFDLPGEPRRRERKRSSARVEN